jgi:hypothetical protein
MLRYLAALIGPVLSLAASAFFFWAWYDRYLRRDFNELGRFYDPECLCVYTTSGFVWVLPACGFLLLALWLAARAMRRARVCKASAPNDA